MRSSSLFDGVPPLQLFYFGRSRALPVARRAAGNSMSPTSKRRCAAASSDRHSNSSPSPSGPRANFPAAHDSHHWRGQTKTLSASDPQQRLKTAAPGGGASLNNKPGTSPPVLKSCAVTYVRLSPRASTFHTPPDQTKYRGAAAERQYLRANIIPAYHCRRPRLRRILLVTARLLRLGGFHDPPSWPAHVGRSPTTTAVPFRRCGDTGQLPHQHRAGQWPTVSLTRDRRHSLSTRFGHLTFPLRYCVPPPHDYLPQFGPRDTFRS